MDETQDAFALARAASGLTLSDVLASQAVIRPTADAVVMGERVLDYAELDALATRLASGLLASGLRPGDRLAVLSRNSLEYVALFHACARAGVALAALNWRFAPAELTHAIAVVEPAMIAVSEDCAGLLDAAGWTGAHLWLDRKGGYDALAESAPGPLPEVDAEAIVSISFTSGSTGYPKAVAISHRALLARAAVIGVDWQLEPGDAFVGWAPLFHIAASDYVFTTLAMSGTYVVQGGFDADAIAHVARSRRIGWLFLVPGTVAPVADALGSDPLPPGQMKLVGVMADLIPPSEMTAICRATGARYLNSYGMTETGLIPCVPSMTEVAAGAGMGLAKTQSAMCRLRFVDEDGRDVPEGAPGELLVRSQTLASGYWNNPAATAEAFAGGWYHTGDVLRRASDGTLHFVGRVSGMIKSGGENIYPAEIERALLSHPAVAEVAAIGMPHPKWGETPVAVVALLPGIAASEEDLRAHLREIIAGYKIPGAFHFIAEDAFTRNVTGKIDRIALRRLLAEIAS